MTDVFVSYARSDRARVEPLAHALKALGLQVFFDIEAIDGGDVFPDVIDKEVKSASVVLGCWTPQALTRTWVKTECLIAHERNVLVPIEIDSLTLLDVPVAFGSLNRIKLTDWQGERQHDGWLTLVRTLANRLQRPELLARQIEKPATHPQGRLPLFVRTSDFLRNLTREKLTPFFEPFGPSGTTFRDGLLRRSDILTSCEIDTPMRFAHFLGQLAHETGGFKYQEERFSYSGGRLWSLFRNRFHDEAEAQLFAGQPEKIANRIYADRMGNGDESSGDGWRYRGRGVLMLTGRDNYRKMSGRIGVDLVSEPDLAIDPEVSLAIAAVWWTDRKVNELADADDVAEITRKLSGGTLHLQDRAAFVARAKAVVGL
jgi:putative chitinase